MIEVGGTASDLGTVPTDSLDVVTTDNILILDVTNLIKKAKKKKKKHGN